MDHAVLVILGWGGDHRTVKRTLTGFRRYIRVSLTQGSRCTANPGLSKSSPSGNGVGPRRAVCVALVFSVVVRPCRDPGSWAVHRGDGLSIDTQRGGSRGQHSRRRLVGPFRTMSAVQRSGGEPLKAVCILPASIRSDAAAMVIGPRPPVRRRSAFATNLSPTHRLPRRGDFSQPRVAAPAATRGTRSPTGPEPCKRFLSTWGQEQR